MVGVNNHGADRYVRSTGGAVRELHYFTTFSLYEKRGSVEFRGVPELRAKGKRVAPAWYRLGYGTDAGLLGYVQ